MGMTNFYQGSLRYDPTGRKRKTKSLNKAQKPKLKFKPYIPEKSTLDLLRKEQSKQYKSLMEEAINDGTFNQSGGSGSAKERMQYTGTLIKGIATMHKSNAVPIINDQEAKDIARMRRG